MIETNYKPLMLHIQKICDENNIRLYTDYDTVLFENEKKEKPYAVFHIQSSGAIEEQERMDLKNECRGGMFFNLIIEAEKIDDIIGLEESISKPLDNSVLYYPRVNGKALEATISLVPDQPSERKVVNAEGTTEKHYQSTYYFQCLGMVFPKIIEHPVQIELDRRKQLNALLRLSFIEYVYNNIKQQMHKLFYVEEHEEFISAEEKFVEMLRDDALREQYMRLHKQLEDLKCQCAEMYNFENLCKEKITMEDEGFRFCYLQMVTGALDLPAATAKYKEKKKAETDRMAYHNAITQCINKLLNIHSNAFHISGSHQSALEAMYIDEAEGTWITYDTSYEFNPEWYDYQSLDENGKMLTKPFDYISLAPISVTTSMTLCSMVKEQLMKAVRTVRETCADKDTLIVKLSLNENETMCFDGEISDDEEIIFREMKDGNGYYLMHMDVVYERCVWNCNNANNKLTDMECLEHILTLLSVARKIEEGCDNLQINEANKKKEKEDELRKAIRKIEVHVYEELAEKLHIPEAHRNEAYYQTYYQLLCNNGCDIKSASEIISREIKERIAVRERSRKAKLLQGKGDAMLNRITDKIVDDIKARLGNTLPVYGGSSYAAWFMEKDCKRTLPYPNILIKVYTDYDISKKEYTNLNKEGDVVKHLYSHDTLPLGLSISCRIYAESEEEVKNIQKQIHNCYSQKDIKFSVTDPVFENEYAEFYLTVDPVMGSIIKIEDEDKKDVWRTNLSFVEQQSVYYTNVLNWEKKKDFQDTVLQLSYIEQAEYCISYVEVWEDAIKCLDTYYKNLFDYGFLSNLFCTEEYKKLKSSIREGKSVDIKLFNKVFEKIVAHYPLFQKFAYGWTYEQIREDLLNIQKQYKEQVENLTELAGIPKTIMVSFKVDDEIPEQFKDIVTPVGLTLLEEHTVSTTSIDARNHEALGIYQRAMRNDIYCTVEKAIEKYRKNMGDQLEVEERQRRQWEAEQQALAEMRAQEAEYESYDEYDAGGHSNGSGFFSSLLSSSIANAGIKREMKKQTKLMREQAEREKERDRMARKRESDARWRAARESQRRFDEVLRVNRERRRKGQPELPLPPRTW